MGLIFVVTKNDPKIFVATQAGSAAAKCEAAMPGAVKAALKNVADFTIDETQSTKGYIIRIKVAKVEKTPGRATVTLSGEIVQYPLVETKERGKGEVMVTTNMSASGYAEPPSDDQIAAVVEALTESMVKKALPFMRIDWAKR